MKMKLPVFFCRKLLREIRSCQHLTIYALVTAMILFSTIYLLKSSTTNDSVVDDDVMVMLNSDKLQKEFIDKKGVHVIVGQYVEKSLKFEDDYNLTSDILNTNNYSPIPGAGENGQPVYLGEFEKSKAKLLFYINKFNLVASDKISVNRSLPDQRKESCRNLVYETANLPKTSVIIVFHNEAWSTLLRTIHSVINRSPRELIEQIILVDDASSRAFLKEQLDSYIEDLSKLSQTEIVILRSKKRVGLIKARLLGCARATGDVLTFLDAHVEVTPNYLEPLLARIKESPNSVVCPIIDIINEQTFAYSKSFDLHWGAINWNLHFRWFAMGEKQYQQNRETNLKYIIKNLNNRFVHLTGLSNQNNVSPFKTPIMAGGLFSIGRKYFYELGAYDKDLEIWGGENIEISIRIWSCGSGRIEIHPCSHVGHLFRKSSPYSFPGGVSSVLYRNLARVIETWMDYDYKLFFYLMIPVLRRTMFGELSMQNDLEHLIKKKNYPAIRAILNNSSIINEKLPNIDQRIRLKEQLKCHNFSWFLETVWPQHFFPTKKRFFGQIKHQSTGYCLQVPSNDIGSNVGRLELVKCVHDSFYKKQLFVYDKLGWLMTDDSLCVDVSQLNVDDSPVTNGNGRANVILIACSEQERQKWRIEFDANQVRHVSSGLCLDLKAKTRYLTLRPCESRKSQLFEFLPINFWSE